MTALHQNVANCQNSFTLHTDMVFEYPRDNHSDVINDLFSIVDCYWTSLLNYVVFYQALSLLFFFFFFFF